MTPVARIPTSVITGHLGAGKTSAIAHLLRAQPDGERWAVIVNEFGELGVDGRRLSGSDDGLLIEEITGGCICCGMGAPLLFVLHQLLERERFDRLLIEPTGLAEPTAVIDSLDAPTIANRLQRMATICLVDMRAAARRKMAPLVTAQHQISASDILVGTFADEATPAEHQVFLLDAYAMEPPKTLVATVAHGALDPACLAVAATTDATHSQSHAPQAHTRSWRYPHRVVFDRTRLDALLRSLAPAVLRAKAIVRTPYGWKSVDVDGAGSVRWRSVHDGPDSRVEVIVATDKSVDFSALERSLNDAKGAL